MPIGQLWLCLAGSMLLLCATGAEAAELDARSPDVYDWSGFFVGSDTGFIVGGENAPIAGAALAPDAGRLFSSGEAAANWQTGQWVLGVEGDVRFADISEPETKGVSGLAYNSEADATWFSTMRLRSGFALDNLLVYGTGGLAATGSDFTVSMNPKDATTQTGWTAGAGMEWGFSDNAKAKVEFLYFDFDDRDGVIPADGVRLRINPGSQSLRVGMDFQF
ncbi:MAG: porin family protein [Rhizobiales bacterium]|nr:porin family protein [Hyphomicrobiales bacterium]